MKPGILMAAALAAVASVTGCGGGDERGVGDLEGTCWTLDVVVTAGGSAVPDPVPDPGSQVAICFEGGRFLATLCCNTCEGAYAETDPGVLSLGGVACTDAACDCVIAEPFFSGDMPWDSTGESLSLGSPEVGPGQVAVFAKTPAP